MRSKDELHDYQSRTIDVLYNSDGIELVMPMGSGKTASALTAAAELIHDKEFRHALVLAPKRVAQLVWPDEIAEWAHLKGLRYEVLTGTPARRKEILLSAPGRDLTIIGIDNTQWLCEELAKLPITHPLFDILIIDEISRFKSPKSKRAKALLKLARRFKLIWGLTGTPRPNGEQDLFKPLAIVSRETVWGRSFYKWQQERFRTIDWEGHDWVIRDEWRDKTNREAAQWMLALDGRDMPELPPVTIVPHVVHLPDDARKIYNDMERELFAELERKDVLAISSAVATGKCAQIANGFLYDRVDGEQTVTRIHAEKLIWLEEMVLDAAGDPLIIIYEFIEDLHQIQKLFPGIPYLGAGTSDADARKHVEAWNRRELPLLALHPASAGHGLNLQHGGNQMAWISPCWSAELWDQAIARLARPGQAEPVFVHVCLAYDTLDDAKRMRVIAKLSAQEAFQRYRLGKI